MSDQMRWVDEIVEAFQRLGGAARYDDLYELIQLTTIRDLTKEWKATVRRTIEDHSSDSANFRAADLFQHIGHGHWMLRGADVSEKELSARSHLTPKQVLDRVFVREHFRTKPKHSSADDDPLFHMISDGPRPVAPFSHATEANGWVFVTGQMPTDPNAPDAPLPEGIEAQTVRVMENLKIVLAGIGLDLSHVMMARCYLTDFYGDYAQFNETYQSFFPADRRPARTTIGVTGLALEALVEIDFVCRRPE